jgi:hypothetical protein
MPLAGAPSAAPTTLEGLVPLLHAPFHPLGVGVTEIVTLPGAVAARGPEGCLENPPGTQPGERKAIMN